MTGADARALRLARAVEAGFTVATSLPAIGSLEGLSLAELRGLVVVLIREVRRLQANNQALRDEVAWLKGLPPRPPSRPLTMKKATGAAASGKTGRSSRRPHGIKRDRSAVTAEAVLDVSVPRLIAAISHEQSGQDPSYQTVTMFIAAFSSALRLIIWD